MKLSMTVLTHTHRHGDTTTVHSSRQVARTTLAEIARYWWHELTCLDGRGCGVDRCKGVYATPGRLSDDDVITIYFRHTARHQAGEESCTLTDCDLDIDPAHLRALRDRQPEHHRESGS